MNYVNEIRAFYDWIQCNSIPADAQALWHVLMHFNNKCAVKQDDGWVWPQEFTVTNGMLQSILEFSKSQLDRMRNVLVQGGRIVYVKGRGNQCGTYSIKPLCFPIWDANRDANGEANATQMGKQMLLNPGTLDNSNSNINTLSCPPPDGSDGGGGADAPRRTKKPKILAPDTTAYKTAVYLFDSIADRIPNNPQTQPEKREATVQRWAADIDKLLRIDGAGRDITQFKRVLAFSQRDPFWQCNILSGESLRKNYTKLLAKVEAERGSRDD